MHISGEIVTIAIRGLIHVYIFETRFNVPHGYFLWWKTLTLSRYDLVALILKLSLQIW